MGDWPRDSLPNHAGNFLVKPDDPNRGIVLINCGEKDFRTRLDALSRYSTYFQRSGVYVIKVQIPETVETYLCFNQRLMFSPDPEQITPFSNALPNSWELITTLTQKLHLWDICGSFGNHLLRHYVEQHIGGILANWRRYYRHPVVHHRMEDPEWCILDNFAAAYQLCIDRRWDRISSDIVQFFVRDITDQEWEDYQESLEDEYPAFLWHAERELAESQVVQRFAEWQAGLVRRFVRETTARRFRDDGR